MKSPAREGFRRGGQPNGRYSRRMSFWTQVPIRRRGWHKAELWTLEERLALLVTQQSSGFVTPSASSNLGIGVDRRNRNPTRKRGRGRDTLSASLTLRVTMLASHPKTQD